MSVSLSVSEIIKNHVTLEIEGIDRMYLNGYIPTLQREIGVFSFFKYHRGALSNRRLHPLLLFFNRVRLTDYEFQHLIDCLPGICLIEEASCIFLTITQLNISQADHIVCDLDY